MELERWRFTNVYSNDGALGGVDEADFTWWVFFARFMNERDFQGLVSEWISRQVYERLRDVKQKR